MKINRQNGCVNKIIFFLAVSIKDLEVTGLDETMVLTPGILKQHTSIMRKKSQAHHDHPAPLKGSLTTTNDDIKLMSMASLLNDDGIFFLDGNSVMKMDIANGKS